MDFHKGRKQMNKLEKKKSRDLDLVNWIWDLGSWDLGSDLNIDI